MKRAKAPKADPYKDWFLVMLSDVTRTKKNHVRVWDGEYPVKRQRLVMTLAQLVEAMGA